MATTTPTLTLNTVHAELLSQVLKLTRYQQSQRIKSIDHCFKTSLNRLSEDEMYTGDEVASIVTALQDTVGNEVQTELKDASHTNGLLIQQLLTNAEQWHLTLTADISELENREKLNMIKDFEDGKQNEKMSITVTQSKQIIPMEDLNVASMLKSEIKTLEEQKRSLNEELHRISTKGAELEELNVKSTNEVAALRTQLEDAHQEIVRLKQTIESQETGMSRNVELEAVQKDIRRMSAELERSRAIAEDEAEKLRQDLEHREDKLRSVQSALLLTEKELDKKFQATAAYVNMKKILVQKNNVIKSLRKKVVECGGNPDGDEAPAGDDD